MLIRLSTLAMSIAVLAFAQSRDANVPKPAKADVPYLLHATNLVETEVTVAKEDRKKNETIYYVDGVSSPARTPLAEPIFLVRADKLQPSSLELYRLEVKNGRREISFQEKRGKGGKPIPITAKKVAGDIWRVEAAAMLENGQYTLTIPGANDVYLFEVY